MNNQSVLISIVTVTYNTGKEIIKTIESVVENLDRDIEYIIIDGGSTDDTVDVIKMFGQHLSYWVTEPDRGIYDAMNKGIDAAKGKYVYFINAGDMLYKLPIKKLKDSYPADIVAFPVKTSNNKIVVPRLNATLKITNTLPHQGVFYKKNELLQYDLHFKVFSDFFLNQAIYKREGKIVIYNEPVVAFHSLDGVSHKRESFNEIFKVVHKNFGNRYVILSRIYFKFIGLSNKMNKLLKAQQ